MPFLAVVEYAPETIARTAAYLPNTGTAMTMIHLCAKTAPNIDGFVIGLKRWAAENNVDTSSSIVLSGFGK